MRGRGVEEREVGRERDMGREVGRRVYLEVEPNLMVFVENGGISRCAREVCIE